MTPSVPLPPPDSAAPTGRGLRRLARVDVAGAMAGVALGVWLTAGVWGGRPPAGDDVMALLIRAESGLDIAGRGHLDGWSPRFITGYEQFLYYGPGFTWLVGLVRAVTIGALSLTGAVKVVAIAGFVAVGPAAAFLARSFGLGRRAAGVTAVLAYTVNSPFGLGLAGSFTIALLPHQVAATFFCLALGSALRVVTDRRRRWVVLLGVSLAAVTITHVLTLLTLIVFLGLSLPFIYATDRPDPARVVGRLGAGGVLAFGLAAFWVVPYVAHFGDRGVVPAWATPPLGDRLADIVAGDILFGPRLGPLVVAGLVYGAWRIAAGRRWAAALVVAPVLFLVVGHTLASRYPTLEVSPQLANRGLGYAGLIAVLPLAAGLARLAALVPRPAGADALAVTGAVLLAVTVIPAADRDLARQMPEADPAMREAARVLRRVVPDGARFATQRDFPAEIERAGVSHPDFWLAWHARRDTLNIFGLELSPSPGAGSPPEQLGDLPPEQSADALARLGVTHVALVDPASFEAFDGSPRFRSVWRRDFLAVFEVIEAMGQPDPSSLLSVQPGVAAAATLRVAEPERLVIAAEAQEDTVATVAVGWSEKWQAEVGGRPVTLSRSVDGLIELDLPAGPQVIDLRFRRDAASRVGAWITALAVGALLGAGLIATRRHRRRATSG